MAVRLPPRGGQQGGGDPGRLQDAEGVGIGVGATYTWYRAILGGALTSEYARGSGGLVLGEGRSGFVGGERLGSLQVDVLRLGYHRSFENCLRFRVFLGGGEVTVGGGGPREVGE